MINLQTGKFLLMTITISLLLFSHCKKKEDVNDDYPPTVTDQDGNIYPTIRIGSQLWMAENLKVTKYRNGTAIPEVVLDENWKALTTPARCWYGNDSLAYSSYGMLYNGFAIRNGSLCPKGWHIPGEEDWVTMEKFLGMDTNEVKLAGWRGTTEGGMMKKTGTSHWSIPNVGATNSSGFSAQAGGRRYGPFGTFLEIGKRGYWWPFIHDSIPTTQGTLVRVLQNDETRVGKYGSGLEEGNSVRCVRD